MIQPISPIPAKVICSGKAVFISFCTPEREVNVEDPVKFIAMNEEIPPIMRNHEISSRKLLPRKPAKNNKIPVSNPIIIPFSENRLKGIHGNKAGVRAQPER